MDEILRDPFGGSAGNWTNGSDWSDDDVSDAVAAEWREAEALERIGHDYSHVEA